MNRPEFKLNGHTLTPADIKIRRQLDGIINLTNTFGQQTDGIGVNMNVFVNSGVGVVRQHWNCPQALNPFEFEVTQQSKNAFTMHMLLKGSMEWNGKECRAGDMML